MIAVKTSRRGLPKLLVLFIAVYAALFLIVPLSVNSNRTDHPIPIPDGMQVVTVPVSVKSMPDTSLLYPGCFVDVLVSFQPGKSRIPQFIPDFIVDVLIKCKLISNRRNALSVTMLRRIQVLSVKRSVRGTFVNLIVKPIQAEALLLAMKDGRLSLSLRNPLDKKLFLEPADNNNGIRIRPIRPFDKIDYWKEQPVPDYQPDTAKIDSWKLQPLHNFRIGPCKYDVILTSKTVVIPNPIQSKWEVTIINGRQVKRETFQKQDH